MPALPSLRAMRAFEAAARLLSFTRVGAELGMTQAAVSWQVNALEPRLGMPLFERRRTGLALTPAGRDPLPDVAHSLACLKNRHSTGLIDAAPRPRRCRSARHRPSPTAGSRRGSAASSGGIPQS